MTNTPPYPSTPSGRPYRYPGVQPFTTAQSEVFFGRDLDIADLYRLIRREALVVLYGKSGLGKSSLLNAGIVPHSLQSAEYEPVVIKFGAWTEGKTDTPLDLTKAYLNAGQAPSPTLQPLLPEEDSLWRCAKNRQLNGAGRPLLLFDQFEELFTYPETAIQAFRQELAELLHTELPLRYRRLLDAGAAPELSEAEEDALETPLEARIVFAIRSDRMHLLHQLADTLPNILRHLYELRALRPEDARAAIVEPAQKAGEFCTPSFTWAAPALSNLLGYLQDPDDDNRVEAILLQLLCQYFEEKLVEKQGLTQIEARHLGEFEQIIENYYHDKLGSLPNAHSRSAARKLIEEGLVLEGENIRLSLHEAQITHQYGVDSELLERLVNSRLLRAEPFLRGGYTYELAHDRLVAPVLRAKQERLAQEAIQAAEQAQLAKEQELAEERGKRQRATWLAVAGFVLTGVALVAALWAWRQTGLAEQSRSQAEQAKTEALDSAAVAQQQRSLAQLEKTKADTSAAIALRKERQALEAEQKAATALQQANGNAKVAVDALLQVAKDAVYHVKYDEALPSILAAAKLEQNKDKVAQALQEIAFVKVESGQNLAEAVDLIEQIRRLKGQAGKGPQSKSAPALRQALQSVDNAHYTALMQRYYPVMLVVKGGGFQMGCDTMLDQRCRDGEDLHHVQVSSFALARSETTFWQWSLYCAANGLKLSDYSPNWGIDGDNPVVIVDWFDACLYANWLSPRFGLEPVYAVDSTTQKDRGGWLVTLLENKNGFRLPTEAEWEYAAKAGQSTIYSGGNELDELGWYDDNSLINGVLRTHPVEQKKKNPWGFYDLSGNVWEWCWDWYDSYDLEQKLNPQGAKEGSGRVLRGGSWYDDAVGARVAYRNDVDPDNRNDNIGFRLARQQ
ncbi:SUMF1/EgtB/PvdO family nonheme iron enzyme [Haliscomenobacter sp.]|uniref:SUMF1/EgtB/PvdO family nonheme iron enzyme n=1 Tax=Haliscomenobacter sp. TaxID=2717303 RepID=UPI0035931353